MVTPPLTAHGSLFLYLSTLLVKELFLISNLNPLVPLGTISCCLVSYYLEEETDSNLAKTSFQAAERAIWCIHMKTI